MSEIERLIIELQGGRGYVISGAYIVELVMDSDPGVDYTVISMKVVAPRSVMREEQVRDAPPPELSPGQPMRLIGDSEDAHD